jgi:hypothetical protein
MGNTHNPDHPAHNVHEHLSTDSDDVSESGEHQTRRTHKSRKTHRNHKHSRVESAHNWEPQSVPTIESLENDPTYNWNLTEQLENTTEYSVAE